MARRPTPSLTLLAAAVAPWLVGCPDQQAAGEGDALLEAVAVHVAPVAQRPLSQLYSTSATLRADRRATVTARTRGVVHELLVEEGQEVEQGQVLARLDDEEQRLDVERARLDHDMKLSEEARFEELHGEGAVSQNDLDAARQAAQAARNALATTELRLSRTVVRAPFAGVVARRHLDQGATVSDGTALFDLVDLDPLHADVSVPERHVTSLSQGQAVRVWADASSLAIEGQVARIAPEVDSTSGTVKVTVVVEGGRELGLRPGTFVRVDVVTDTHPDALVVPRSALVAAGQRWNLFRAGADGRAELLEVTLGYEDDERVEVIETRGGPALEVGQRVVVAGASTLAHGTPLEASLAPLMADAQDDSGAR
jgi:membrane fusion protein, multidrug efflux system